MTPELPDDIRFGRTVCGDLQQAERREWWLANGQGAYAAGTLAHTLTRRYHGLLIAPTEPPLGRHLLWAKADATLLDGAARHALHANRWGSGAVDPAGQVHLESFVLDGTMPVWCWALEDVRIEQRIWMEPGRHTTYVAWRLLADPGRPLALRVRLLINGRDHHGQGTPWGFDPPVQQEAHGQLLTADLGAGTALHFRVRAGELLAAREWVNDFLLPAETERGLPDRDQHLHIGEARLPLHPGDWVGVVGSLAADAAPYFEEALRRHRARDLAQLKRARVCVAELTQAPSWVQQLVLAANSYVFARPLPGVPDGESVIAGYPWFGDWGRDTMIALPGLTLATGRYDSARRILTTFARFIDGGMLPNVFPGAGERPEYNTVDAALWYVEAVRAYHATTGDRATLALLYPVLCEIVAAYRDGTRYGIVMDPADALLRAGAPGVQLTWMDAKIGDWVVTPRTGKAVEINALWHNALAALAELAPALHRDGSAYTELAQRVRQGFVRFRHPHGGLHDVLDTPDGDDAALRPNQIFAVSLPHSPLDPGTQREVVALCGRVFATSYGLRTLAPTHADYRGRHAGGVYERDSAYHQGPAWAWLLGHYALAHLRVHGDAQAAQNLLTPIRDHLADAGLGTVSELFDGDAPHTPRGAPAQAWSVACVLEAWWRLEQARRQAADDTPAAADPTPGRAAAG